MKRLLNRFPFVQHLIIYIGSALASQGISILAFPLWVVYFSADEYGMLALMQSSQLLFLMLTSLNLSHVFTIQFCHVDKAERGAFIQNIFLLYSTVFCAALLCTLPFIPLLNSYLFAAKIPSYYLTAGLAMSALMFGKNIVFLILQHTEQSTFFSVLHLIENGTYIASILIGVVIFGGKIGCVLLAQCISLSTVIATFFATSQVTIRRSSPSLSALVALAKEGVTLYPFLITTQLFSLSDRLIINHYAGLSAVGLYAFANKFAQLFQTFFVQPLRRSYTPFIQKQYKKSLSSGFQQNNLYTVGYFILTCGALVIGFAIGKPFLFGYTPAKFHTGLPLLLFLMPASIFFGALTFSTNFLWYLKQKKTLTSILVCVVLANAILNRLTVTTWGVIGCAFSTFLCSVAYFVATLLFQKRVFLQYAPPQKRTAAFKILHCIDSLQSGGIPSVLHTLIAALKRSHPETEHCVVFIRNGPVEEKLKTLRVKMTQIRSYLPRYDISLLPRLMYLIYRERPTMVHLTMTHSLFFGRLACWLMRTPCTGAIHGNMNYMGRFSHYGMRLMGGMATRYITVSKETHQVVCKKLPHSFDTHNVALIPNGLDLTNIQKQKQLRPLTRAMVGLADDAFVIGSVGRFSPEKSFDILIRSLADLQKRLTAIGAPQKAQLCLVGYGPEMPALVKLSETLGVANDVFFVGQQANPFPYYSLFDAFSLSSQTEGDPLVILEAMTFGIPVVITHGETTHPTIKQGKNGFFVPLNDCEGLAKKLFTLATNKTIRQTIGQAGKTLVEQRSSADIMAARYLTVFKEAAHSFEKKV